MSFYFRKLRTRCLMPTAKRSLGFGFSTRVNEKERKKIVSPDSAVEASSAELVDNPDPFRLDWSHLPQVKVHTFVPAMAPTSAVVPLTLSQLHSLVQEERGEFDRLTSDLCQKERGEFDRLAPDLSQKERGEFNRLVPDLSQKKRGEFDRLAPDLSQKDRDILDTFLESVRPIHFSCDDIFLADFGRPWCERISVDILTEDALSGLKEPKNSTMPQTSGPSPNTSVNSRTEGANFDVFGYELCCAPPTWPQRPESEDNRHGGAHLLLYSAGASSSSGQGAGPSKNSSPDGPSPEQLHNIKERLENLVMEMFTSRHDYTLLHKNVTLENNLYGDNQVSTGTTAYALALLRLRLFIHARYSSTEMEVLHVSTLEQNGVVRIHWRLKGVPQLQLLKFWKFFHVAKEDVEWTEAFSYFHIGKDGLVHKHRIDRMLPDDERKSNRLTKKLQTLLSPAKPLVS